VITNFIDNSEFDECTECQRTQFANPDEKILIHVSNLRPVKRVEEVLQILKMLRKR
jgi:glycosyltransferase involved in cell wall biosynthesis